MRTKLAALSILVVLLLAALLCSAAVASAAKQKSLRYRTVKRMSAYVLVKGHGQKLRVRKDSRLVIVGKTARYRVVSRKAGFVVLVRLTGKVPGNTPIVSGEAQRAGLSASASSHLKGCAPSACNDGKAGMRWSAASCDYPQWWMVDLGSVKKVTGVRTNWYAGGKRVYRYRVQTSRDGVSFTVAADRSKNRMKGVTTDAVDVTARYVRIRVLGSSAYRAPASASRITVFADETAPAASPSTAPEPAPTAVSTPSPVPTTAPRGQSGGPVISSLSASHARIGTEIAITGSGFGTAQSSSFVVFGERINEQGWAACARKAAVRSWSDSEIRVTVPAMSPGKAGHPGTYHPVYVVLNPTGTWAPDFYSTSASQTLSASTMSNSVDFYMEPAYTITAGTSQSVIDTVLRSAQSSGTWNATTATYTTDSDIGVWPNNGVHDVLFDGVTLTATNRTIGAFAAGALTLGEGRSHSRLTFLDCTLTGLQGPGSGGRYGIVGVKVWSQPAAPTTDLSFVGCSFGTPASGGFNDMGLEIVNPGTGEAGQGPSERFAMIDCTIEPAGGQALSFGSGGDVFALVSGCTFKGAGNDPKTGWHAVFEANSTHYIHWRDSEVWNWDQVVFNMNGVNAGGVSVFDIDPHLLFERLNVDFGHTYQSSRGKANSSIFAFGNRSHVRVKDCAFNTGSAGHCCQEAGTAHPDWEAPNWRNCQYNDFTGSVITGHVTTNGSGGRAAARVPGTPSGYWDYASFIPRNNILPGH